MRTAGATGGGRKLLLSFLAGGALFLAGGCVSTATFQKQVMETRSLQENVQSLDAANRQLLREKEMTGNQLAVMAGELQALTQAKEQLTAERDQVRLERDRVAGDNAVLEKALQARNDSFSRNIADLRQKAADVELETTNLRALLASREQEVSRLKEELVAVRKSREQEMRNASTLLEELLDKLKSEISRGDVTVGELQGTVTVTIPAGFLFDPGRAELKNAGAQLLKKLSDVVAGMKERNIRVDAATDAQSLRGGSRTSTWEISALRAVGVIRSFQQQGIDAARLSAVASGGDEPEDGRGSSSVTISFLPR